MFRPNDELSDSRNARGVFLWHSCRLSAALVFVIHSVGVLDAAPVTVAQGSLYGEESALHYQATSLNVVLYVHAQQ